MRGHLGRGGPALAEPMRPAGPEACQPGFPEPHADQPAAVGKTSLIFDAAGFDLRPDPLEASTPAGLSAALRQYRIWAGQPSLRELARRCGGTPAASTICMMLRSEHLPAFGSMIAFLDACGAGEEDRQRFATAWRRISLSMARSQPGTQQAAAPRSPAGRLPVRQDQ